MKSEWKSLWKNMKGQKPGSFICFRWSAEKQKPLSGAEGFFNLMPGSSLLSHGETPHYHRRYGVS
ncbi:hypothetical protein P2G73_17615, partial [Cronobacter sakazakii]|nr:hypothetical protein [Cronobacter sakazakii]